MVKNTLKVGHIYPSLMNVYGDMGNVITLRYRCEARGIGLEYLPLNSLNDLKNNNIDILIGGGGQDSNQNLVQADLIKYANELRALCNDGLVTLVICGMYQLLGSRFILSDKKVLQGANILDIETFAASDRLIGNIVVKSDFGELVGFENHSGRTYLGSGVSPLGRVIKGAGNNGEDGSEGALFNNVFGSYLHGPILSKNPLFADELINRALSNKGIKLDKLPLLDDTFEQQAAKVAKQRPR